MELNSEWVIGPFVAEVTDEKIIRLTFGKGGIVGEIHAGKDGSVEVSLGTKIGISGRVDKEGVRRVQANGEEIVYRGETSLRKIVLRNPEGNKPFAIEFRDDNGRVIAQDRLTGAYRLEPDGGFQHYIRRWDDEIVVGAGERTGGLDKAGGVWDMKCCDAMGYNPHYTDPLYKYIPFFTCVRKKLAHSETEKGYGVYGMYYPSALSLGTLNFGREFSNYHEPYHKVAFEHANLNYIFIHGMGQISNVCKGYMKYTGRMFFGPRFDGRIDDILKLPIDGL